MAREALIERNTKETQIRLQLNIDGTGSSDIDTGIGFFDHMLDGFTRHGLYDLTLRVHGDLNVDDHHTIEDTGIVLGNAIREAVGDKKGIKRYGGHAQHLRKKSQTPEAHLLHCRRKILQVSLHFHLRKDFSVQIRLPPFLNEDKGMGSTVCS